jgi:hypothetical protein
MDPKKVIVYMIAENLDCYHTHRALSLSEKYGKAYSNHFSINGKDVLVDGEEYSRLHRIAQKAHDLIDEELGGC